MFSDHTPMRLVGCNGKQLREGSERRRALVLSFQLQPFTAEMAADLHIKTRLFSTRDGEPLNDVISTTLAISAPPQRVEIRLAPDQGNPSVELPAAMISPTLIVRKDKEGPVYSATLNIISDYPSGDNLLLLMQRVTEQFFITLHSEQGDMLGQGQTRLVEAEEENDEDEVVRGPLDTIT